MKHGSKSPSVTHGDVSHALNKKHNSLIHATGDPGSVVEVKISKGDDATELDSKVDAKKDSEGLAPEGSGSTEGSGDPGDPHDLGNGDPGDRSDLLDEMIAKHTDRVKPDSMDGKARALMQAEKMKMHKK